nr:MAG TPA: hypothetical protein [Bacteriophage sp.]
MQTNLRNLMCGSNPHHINFLSPLSRILLQ